MQPLIANSAPRSTAALSSGIFSKSSLTSDAWVVKANVKYIKYNDLLGLGIPEATVDTWRAGNSINARIMAQMPPESAAAAFGGIVPPDLSLIAIAREGGMHYLYTYMTAYKIDEKGELVNLAYPGTRMPDILSIASVTDEKQRDDQPDQRAPDECVEPGADLG